MGDLSSCIGQLSPESNDQTICQYKWIIPHWTRENLKTWKKYLTDSTVLMNYTLTGLPKVLQLKAPAGVLDFYSDRFDAPSSGLSLKYSLLPYTPSLIYQLLNLLKSSTAEQPSHQQ